MSSRDWSKEDNFQVSGYYLKQWRRSLLFRGQILRFPQIAIKVRTCSVITCKFKIFWSGKKYLVARAMNNRKLDFENPKVGTPRPLKLLFSPG